MAEPVVLNTDEVVAHLAGSSLFALLDLESLRRLAPLFAAVHYAAMQTITRQGDTDSTLWLVVEGMVALEHTEPAGTSRTTRLLGYGETIGQHGVFAGAARETTAVTVDPTTLLYAEADPLWAALRADPVALDHLVLPDTVRERMALPAAGEAVSGEVAVATYRRHWVYLVRGLLVPVTLLILAVPAMFLVAPALGSTLAILVLVVLALGLPLAGVAWAVLEWRMDYLMVTNRRVIHVDKMPLVSERRREVPLGRVQDIRAATPNLMARLLGYGVLSVQTAGTRGNLTFRPVAEPETIRETIMAQVEQAQAHGHRERQTQIAQHIRASLGLVGPEALAPQSVPGAEPPSVDQTRPGPLAFLIPFLTYWVPQMRREEGATVTWRKHWWVLLRNAGMWLVGALVLLAVLVVSAAGIVPLPWWAGVPFWLVVGGGLWWTYENWRNDYYQLTDSHVIDVEQLPLGLFRARRQAGLGQIQDIRYEVPNPLAMFLHFGNVLIETAAETGNFTFDYVHEPASVQREIFARIDGFRARAQEQAEARQADEFARWIQQYHEIAGGARPPDPAA
jgi:hypothetical protein